MNAARPSFVSFQAIKERVPIRDILDHYGLWERLIPQGEDTLLGPCPIHHGKHPSQFRVSLAKNCWNCFGPCRGGNILDLVAGLEGVTLAEAARLIDGWFPAEDDCVGEAEKRSDAGNVPTRAEMGREAPEPGEGYMNPVLPFGRLKNLDFDHAYLRGERGFDRATLEYFGVGFCTKGMHRGRIAIPIHNRKGELVSYLGYERETGQYRYHEAFRPELELFNVHRMGGEDLAPEPLFLTADPFDVLRLHETGHRNAVALPSDEMSDRQRSLLAERVGEGGRIALVVAEGYPRTHDVLVALSARFYVRLTVTETRLSDWRNAKVRALFGG